MYGYAFLVITGKCNTMYLTGANKCAIMVLERGEPMNKPGTISRQDAENIMRQLDPRDRDIFRISMETGLRIGDILKLTVSDVQHNPLLIYESKSKRRRQIEISGELHEHLKQKYKYRWSFGFGNASTLLFKSHRGTGKAINRSTYHRRLKRVAEALKINFSAHSGKSFSIFLVNSFINFLPC